MLLRGALQFIIIYNVRFRMYNNSKIFCKIYNMLQVKSLFRHMEEEHGVVVPKERRTFKSLAQFYQWLCAEEKKHNVRYIRDTTRMEKNNMKLIQMVCHRFHSAKVIFL